MKNKPLKPQTLVLATGAQLFAAQPMPMLLMVLYSIQGRFTWRLRPAPCDLNQKTMDNFTNCGVLMGSVYEC